MCEVVSHLGAPKERIQEKMPVRGGKAGMKPQGILGSSQGEQGGRERVLPPKPRGLGDSF